jgi:hypothetical protein
VIPGRPALPPVAAPHAGHVGETYASRLRAAARAAHISWAPVLASLRLQRAAGSSPPSAARLHTLAERLAELGARSHPARALEKLLGHRNGLRALVLTRLYSAVGLQALTEGVETAKADLASRLLADPHIDIYPGGRGDLEAGRIDVRVLIVISVLRQAFGGLTISSLESGHSLYTTSGNISAHASGRAVDVSALSRIPITGHQQLDGPTARAIRILLRLPEGFRPAQLISLLDLGGASFALPDHWNHLHVGF